MKIGNIGTQASKLAANTVNRETAKPSAPSVAVCLRVASATQSAEMIRRPSHRPRFRSR